MNSSHLPHLTRSIDTSHRFIGTCRQNGSSSLGRRCAKRSVDRLAHALRTVEHDKRARSAVDPPSQNRSVPGERLPSVLYRRGARRGRHSPADHVHVTVVRVICIETSYTLTNNINTKKNVSWYINIKGQMVKNFTKKQKV
ncbi:unnamed protein product [Aphis gossypii]|uniref:Uncharacterized protein n=1 Tax=Aphis gossypii TaxID=80765 RepID=A0A9P0NBM6_APHGO|nr:unnamed protein product [Aphis gossypii]